MKIEPSRRACEAMLWFILFFSVAAFGATEWWSRALLEALIFILAAMCCLRNDCTGSMLESLAGWTLILVLGAAQAFDLRPLDGPAALFPFTAARPQTLYALLFMAALAALFWCASGILRWEGALWRLAFAVFLIGIFIAIVGIVQRGQGNTAYYGLRPILPGCNPFGPFTNYNHAANWIAAASLVGVGFILRRLISHRHIPASDRAAQTSLAAFAAAILVGAVVETGSRGGLVSFVLALFLTGTLIFTGSGSLRTHVMGGLLFVFVVAGLAYLVRAHPRYGVVLDGGVDRSAADRLSMYRSGLQMWLDFPVFGVGLGTLQRVFHGYQERALCGLVDHVHSSWLEVVLESGIFGGAALALTLLSPLARFGVRLARHHVPEQELGWGIFAAGLASLIHGCFEFTWQIPANAALLVVILAAASAWIPSATCERESGRTVGWVVCLALAGLSLFPGASHAGFRLGPPFINDHDRLVGLAAGSASR